MSWRLLSKNKNALSNKKRIDFLSIVFLISALIVTIRLFDLQVLKGGFYAALAADQHELYKSLFPERGSIYCLDDVGGEKVLYPLVTNRPMPSLYASPREVVDASSTAHQIFEIIGFPPELDLKAEEKNFLADLASSSDQRLAAEVAEIRRDNFLEFKREELINTWIEALSDKSKGYYSIRQKLPEDQVDKIKELKLKGIGFQDQDYRYYPEKGLGGQIFGFWGFVDNDRRGSYGLEGYFEDVLSGENGQIKSERDAWGNVIALGKSQIKEKVDGADLVLTLNRSIQYVACQSLKKSIDKHKAKSGTIIVMDPKTGAILAMCSFPDYDPENYSKVSNISFFNNKAIFDAWEPGSIFKPITMAAAINEGKVSPDSTYVDTGVVDYGKYQIRNFENKTYGLQTMTNVLEFSLNTGVIHAMRQIGAKTFSEYVRRFGFGQLTGIEMSKEMPGNISNLDLKGEINTATITFGQGISVTPIQMITAFSAIINGGKLMKPYIVSQIIRGDDVEVIKPQEVRQVVSAKTSVTMKGMLVSVVENGHVKSAQLSGWRVGGKTGTAQIHDDKGGYKKDEIIGAFVGFAPFADPKVAILVRVDEPLEGKLGEVVAVPVFKEVAKFALQYYNVAHDK